MQCTPLQAFEKVQKYKLIFRACIGCVKFFPRGIAVGKPCSYAVTGYGAGAWRPGGVSPLWAWVRPRSIGKPHFLQMQKCSGFPLRLL